jgi:uncharacterized protein (DUF1330 family)
MAYYVILDVTIHDLARYQEYMVQVKPMIEAAGASHASIVGVEGI